MRKAIFVVIFIISCTTFAQKSNEYVLIDKKALQIQDSLTGTPDAIAGYIKSNFKTDTEKTRAIYIWVSSNIQYDIQNIFAINFYEKQEEKITKALKNRKGICENFAALFNNICLKAGIKSFVIEGYTKQNGFTDYIPHAWCAALIDTSWFLFDPTWGSGYMNGGKFYKKTNNAYCKADPAILIKSHMPFDYLWQFLYYPVTNQEFAERKTQQNNSKPFFNYRDSIEAYEKQSYIEQMNASAGRIERNGVNNTLIFDRLQHLRREIEIFKNNQMVDRHNEAVSNYNKAVIDYNDGIRFINEFINYRNKQFTPMKPDQEIQEMIDESENKLNDSKTKLGMITGADANTGEMIFSLYKSVNDAINQVNEQKSWLRLYFSKGKSARKSMFYKTSWYGIPLN